MSIIIDEEQFVAHPIFSNYYASIRGSVYSSLTDKVIRGSYDKDRYLDLSLMREGKRIHYKKHRFVYECFHGVIPKNLQIDHINRVKDDNRLINLRVVNNRTNHFNKSNNTAIKVDELPSDAIEITSIRDMNFENYYYSPSTNRVYLLNDEFDEIYQLAVGSHNQVRLKDINNKNHGFSMRTIRALVLSELTESISIEW